MNIIEMGFDFIEVFPDTVHTDIERRGDEDGFFAALDASTHGFHVCAGSFFISATN
jgi:hypothetical protein